jgi:hypothetical protein
MSFIGHIVPAKEKVYQAKRDSIWRSCRELFCGLGHAEFRSYRESGLIVHQNRPMVNLRQNSRAENRMTLLQGFSVLAKHDEICYTQ